MKKIGKALFVLLLSVFLITLIFANSFGSFGEGNTWTGDIASEFKGEGTKENPYVITEAKELALLAQKVNYGNNYSGCYFELGADIILNVSTNWQEWGKINEQGQINAPINKWTPIGLYSDRSFKGYFDGKDHTVSGMYVNDVKGKHFGLFGYTYNYGEINVKNVKVINSYVFGTNLIDTYTAKVGGVVGYGNVENCHFMGNVIGDDGEGNYIDVGGVVGYGKAVNCTARGSVKANDDRSNAGGIIGGGDATNCINYATVDGNSVGGITGSGDAYYCENYGDLFAKGSDVGGITCSGTAQYCKNAGTITANNCYSVGGICGSNYVDGLEHILQYCFNEGDIYVENCSNVGGVAGNGFPQNSYNSGTINCTDCTKVGGVVGFTGYNYYTGGVNRCYNVGTINGSASNVGAVIGYNESDSDNNYLFFLDTSYPTDEYGVKLTASQMKDRQQFTSYNFNKVWEYIEGAEYPYPTLRYFGSKIYGFGVDIYDGNNIVSSQTIAENETYVLKKLGDKGNLKFVAFEREGEYYLDGDSVTVTEDMSFNAVWKVENKGTNVWDGSSDTDWDGEGTQGNPYKITSSAELAGLAERVNNGENFYNTYFSLENDIYLNDSYDYSYVITAENIWEPIGNYGGYTKLFNGHFDGKNHTVYGLYIKNSSEYVGLFGFANGTISNLSVKNSYVGILGNEDSGIHYTGAIAGRSENVTGCKNYATVEYIASKTSSGNYYIGGVVGDSYNTAEFCENYGSVKLNSYSKAESLRLPEIHLGGVVGDGSTVKNCKNYADIYTENLKTDDHSWIYLSGVVSRGYIISDCENYGNIYSPRIMIDASGSDIISISGITHEASYIENCKNSGKIKGEYISAGIAYYVNQEMENCENTGNVTGEEAFGIAYNLSNAKNLVNRASVTAHNFSNYSMLKAGGIAYSVKSASDCKNYGKIDAFLEGKGSVNDLYVSGLFCQTAEASYPEAPITIERCINYGQVSLNNDKERYISNLYAAGILGKSRGYAFVKESANNGKIYASNLSLSSSDRAYIGGVVGDGDLENCYNTGTITVTIAYCSYETKDTAIGGVAGRASAVNCYNVGKINITNNDDTEGLTVGGVVGNKTLKDSENCYYLDSVLSGAEYNNIGIAKTDSALKDKKTFTDYDFNKIWEMNGLSGYSYPNLRFMGSGTHRYFVTFKDEGKNLFTEAYYNSSILTFTAPVIKSGYRFEYWQNQNNKYFENDTVTVNSDLSFDAVWTKLNNSEAWDNSIDTVYEGNGTEESPYLISSAAELAGLRQLIAVDNNTDFASAYYKQTKDIYINSAYNYSSTVMAENSWRPIGNENSSNSLLFSGTYDGNGFTVYGLYFKNDDFNMSLFGDVENATFKNVTLKNGYLGCNSEDGGAAMIGALISKGENVTLINCTNFVNIESNVNADRVGGLIGIANGVTLQNSVNFGTIKGKNIGGLIGWMYNSDEMSISIDGGVNYGDIINTGYDASTLTGGIAAKVNEYNIQNTSEIKNCVNEGEIFDKRGKSGGIIGIGYMVTIENCQNKADIKGDAGIAGYFSNGCSVKKCINYGDVTNEYDSAAGIVMGCNYNTYISVTENENHGDIIGLNYAAGIISHGEYAYIDSCINHGNIQTVGEGEHAGGIACGRNCNYLSGCINYGKVSSYRYVGGIVSQSASVFDCINYGEVRGELSYVGGIAGDVEADYSYVSGCINHGDVYGYSWVGGISGGMGDSDSTVADCVNLGNITGIRNNIGGILGDSYECTLTKCYNAGNVESDGSFVGGIVGDGNASLSYNKGDVTGSSYVGGISGDDDATDCFSFASVKGGSYVGGITGDGDATRCYVLGYVNGDYRVGSVAGDGKAIDCYYSAVVTINNEYDEPELNGTYITLDDLKAGNMQGFDFESVWMLSGDESYPYPVLRDTVYYATYTVTFLDADGVTVLKEQKVNEGFSASPPVIEPFTDQNFVYAIDHWDTEYTNIKKDTTVKAVYKKTEKIKFKGRTFEIFVPFGYSVDNLTAKIESEYKNIIAHTTNGYKMKVEAEFDLSPFEVNTSGIFEFVGKADLTQSPYYEMAEGESFIVKVTVNPSLDNEFDIADLTFIENNGQITITGYNGKSQEIRIPEKINGKTVTEIGEYAFKDNQNITGVYLPEGVKVIGVGAFENAVNLVALSLPESLEEINAFAFYNTSLNAITVGANVWSFGEKAFGVFEDETIKEFTVFCVRDSIAEAFAKENGLNISYISLQTNQTTGISANVCEGVTLNASKVVGGDYYETAQSITEKANVSMFEITLSNDTNAEIQPDNMMRISIPLPEGYSEKAKIYRINADGSYLDMNATFKDGKLVFDTAHLSYYAIISEDESVFGDCNGDGKFDTVDLAELKLLLAGLKEELIGNADLNEDKAINTVDLAEMKLMLAGLK